MRFALPVLLVGAIAVACGDDDEEPTGPTVDDLAGSWDATSLLLTWNANPAVSVDLVQTFGGTVTLVITAAGRYTFTAAVPGQAVQTITGDFTITGTNQFSLTNDDDPLDVLNGTFVLDSNGNELDINLPDATILDFDEDGEDDEALLEGNFLRT
jgi:hypothetical protein